jgi:RNA polymerase sigma factor for flagellar operon FliA
VDVLLRQHAGLVRLLAHRMAAKLPAEVDVDDLIQVGMIGLSEALSRFDAGQGVQFETFATQRIRGAMLDELRGNDWMTRNGRRHQRRIEAAVRRLEQRLGRAPREGEVAGEMGLGVREYQALADRAQRSLFVSLEDLDEEPAAIDPAVALLDALEAAQRSAAVGEAFARLPEREQHVLSSYYIDGEPFASIARRLGVTESRACQLHWQAVRRLRRMLPEWGPLGGSTPPDAPKEPTPSAPSADGGVLQWAGVRWG